jgi:uncharacterized protein YqeY
MRHLGGDAVSGRESPGFRANCRQMPQELPISFFGFCGTHKDIPVPGAKAEESEVARAALSAMLVLNPQLGKVTMLLDEIKSRMFKAMKEGRIVEKEILRVAVGEITTDAARAGKSGSDEESQAILRKLIKSNDESLALTEDTARRAALELENRTLAELLPKTLTVEEIVAQLDSQKSAIIAAGNEGQATGVAMKFLKGLEVTVNGKDVALAVKQLRVPPA